LGQNIELHLRDNEVDAAADRLLFDRLNGARALRQRRKAVRQPELRLHTPQSEGTDEAFALGALSEPRHRKLTADLGVEHIPAGLVELGHGPGLAELL